MAKNILVVGGAGYVGSAVCDLLLGDGHAVRVYDCLLFHEDYRGSADFVYGDVRDEALLRQQLAWADSVVWLAALVADAVCDRYPDLAWEINERRVAWLVENFDGRILFPSSSLVYQITGGTLSEDDVLGPTSTYQKTKVAAEGHLASRALVLRLATLFGLADRSSRPRFDLVANLLTARAAANGEMTVFGGAQSRAFLHVRDVAQVMVDHVDTDISGVFNVHAENLTIRELATRIQLHVPSAGIEEREADTTVTGDVRLSSDRARDLLGFRPRRTLDEGICEVRDLVASGRLVSIQNPRYSNAKFFETYPLEDAYVRVAKQAFVL
jgi:nucleoside-diphosphate-sugar epimerase